MFGRSRQFSWPPVNVFVYLSMSDLYAIAHRASSAENPSINQSIRSANLSVEMKIQRVITADHRATPICRHAHIQDVKVYRERAWYTLKPTCF